jgi:hypothetical protein
MINIRTIETAPMFTIFRGGKDVAETNTLDGTYGVYWAFFKTDDDPCDDEVLDKLELDDILPSMFLIDNCPVSPEALLERADEDGVAHMVSDLDAALWALNNDYDLIKVPDEIGQPAYRMYVLKAD